MPFTLDASKELRIPNVLFRATSACGFVACLHFRQLLQKGIAPLKDQEVLQSLSLTFPPIYTLGPLHLLKGQEIGLEYLQLNLWREETGCLEWLDQKVPDPVVYVNFGSTTVMTSHQLVEFAWGLASSNKNFFVITRTEIERLVEELMDGEKAKEVKKRALDWKKLAEEATEDEIGQAYLNLEDMINKILLSSEEK
ncbi:unnamed protein product, partial [Linum tenue]